MRYQDEFQYEGDTYTIQLLLDSRVVKVYDDTYHTQRLLIMDRYCRLFVYNYQEEMNFNGGDDRVDHLWVPVDSLTEADKLADLPRLQLLREPFIAADETGWFNVAVKQAK